MPSLKQIAVIAIVAIVAVNGFALVRAKFGTAA
jgi:hypothetical protein